MVGKLDLALGDDYAYDIRRARLVAETRNNLGDGEIIDGDIIPFVGTGAGQAYDIAFKADGATKSFRHTLVAYETKEQTLAALAAAAAADASISQGLSNDTVVVLATAGPELSGGIITRVATASQAGLPVGEVAGPFANTGGDEFWLRRDLSGKWFAGWSVDADPEPEVWRKLTALMNDSSIDLDYRRNVRVKATEHGWDGSS